MKTKHLKIVFAHEGGMDSLFYEDTYALLLNVWFFFPTQILLMVFTHPVSCILISCCCHRLVKKFRKSTERWQHDCEPLERLLLRVDMPHLTKSDLTPIWWSCRWAAKFVVQWKPGLSCVVRTWYKTECSVFTCVNPGEGAGFGTEVGPVIGCGGLFISRSFMVLH